MSDSPDPVTSTLARTPSHRLAWPRRDFVRAGAGTLAGLVAAPRVLVHRVPCPPIRRLGPLLTPAQRALLADDPAVQALAQRAVEAARAAGASYADARLTYTRDRSITPGFPNAGITETEVCHVGVRALVDGYWGFATHPYWTPDAVAWLGRAAVAQAKAHAGGPRGPVELGPVPRVTTGRWETPLAADPFALPVEEAWDRFGGLLLHGARDRRPPLPAGHRCSLSGSLGCWRELQVFASSEGSSVVQTRTRTRAALQVTYSTENPPRVVSSSPPPFLGETARGLEAAIDEAAVLAWVPQAVEECRRLIKLPARPVEVGRYDMVWDAASVANFLGGSLGQATQVDRILGYEANAGGTSYLGSDPLAVVGTRVGAPLVTVTADRTKPGGLATVGWDAEGVAPEPYPLVKDGVLVDLQATRAEAAALAPYYQKAGLPAKSKGSADAASAHGVPLTYTPNLVLTPGAGSAGLDELVRQLGTGLLLRQGQFTMDFQASTGFGGQGQFLQVRGGKVVAMVTNAAALARSSEVWGRIKALGGPASVEAHAQRSTKGEPPQQTAYTAWTVPAVIGDVTLMRAS